MKTTSWYSPHTHRTALIRGLWAGALTLSILGGSAVSRGRADDLDLRDLQNEVTVRATLAKDPRLAALNLIVRVNNRVATLSGPVPSRELAQRAVEAAKKVPELSEVRDKMTVQHNDTGNFLPLPMNRPPRMPLGNLTPPAPATPPNLSDLKTPEITRMGQWVPVNPPAEEPPLKDVALLPWIIAQPGLTGPVSRPKDVPLGKAAESLDAAAISSAMQSLIHGEDRYRRLHYEVKQNKVYLSGTVHVWADLQELARAATRIPGVEAVVLKEVKTDPTRK